MSTDDPALAGLLGRISVVLVETSHPGNIGAVARAMKNMGLSKLTLVNPVAFPHVDADSRASGATDVLGQARVVSSLDEALADCALVCGASARQRSLPWPVVAPPAAAGKVLAAARQEAGVALVFGREDSGLSNDELQRCHYHVQIPTVSDFSSLNVAMAVQVISYEVRLKALTLLEEGEGGPHVKRHVGEQMLSPLDSGWDSPPATSAEFDRFLEHLERVLVAIEFHDPARPRQLMQRLRRLFQRSHPDRMEINILRGVLRDVEKKLAMLDSSIGS